MARSSIRRPRPAGRARPPGGPGPGGPVGSGRISRIDISLRYIKQYIAADRPARSPADGSAGTARSTTVPRRPRRITLVSVSFRSGALDGVQTSPTGGQVEYLLARNAVIREFRKGRLSRLDVCDAHPELLRVARNLGRPTGEQCPICEESDLVEVTFVFGSRLPPGGRCVATQTELARYWRRKDPVVCYVIEVCAGARGTTSPACTRPVPASRPWPAKPSAAGPARSPTATSPPYPPRRPAPPDPRLRPCPPAPAVPPGSARPPAPAVPPAPPDPRLRPCPPAPPDPRLRPCPPARASLRRHKMDEVVDPR